MALCAIMTSIISGSSSSVTPSVFVQLIEKEIVGALLVGVVASLVLYKLFTLTQDVYRQIFISLLAVSFAYVACEALGFSSAIAAVVCGISFATYMDKPDGKIRKHFKLFSLPPLA